MYPKKSGCLGSIILIVLAIGAINKGGPYLTALCFGFVVNLVVYVIWLYFNIRKDKGKK